MRLRREGRNGGIGGFSLSVAEGNTQGVGYYGGFKRLKQAANEPPSIQKEQNAVAATIVKVKIILKKIGFLIKKCYLYAL